MITNGEPLELFDSSRYGRNKKQNQARRLYYVTNASNLRGILSSGLIRPKQGWPKYIPDFQEDYSGHIPFFCDGVPFASLETVTAHDRHDFPVILEFQTDGWKGNGLLAVDQQGKTAVTDYSSLPESTVAVMTAGVVPLADLRMMHFRKPEEAKRFGSDCLAMANVRPDLVPMGTDIRTIPEIVMAPPKPDALPAPEHGYDMAAMRRLDAIGGALSALLRMQNKGSHGLLRRVFPEWAPDWADAEDADAGFEKELADTIVAWMEGGSGGSPIPNAVVLRLALTLLADQPFARGLSPESFLDALDAHVTKNLAEHHDVFRSRLKTMRASVVHDHDPARFFQETGSAVMRGILLLLLDNGYREERRLPAGCSAAASDILVAEILRGALHGWTRVPVTMRGLSRAELAIGYAMARISGDTDGSFKFPPKSFEWIDEHALLGRLLSDIIKGVTDSDARKRLQRYAASQGATGLEIKIVAKPSRKKTKPSIIRDLKGTKNKKLCLQLELPLV